jgi:hypothetical protein
MNFLQALEEMKKGNYVRRSTWEDGVAAFILDPNNQTSRFEKHQHLNKPYLATCHVAACELAGVKLLEDFDSTDWELY